MKTGTLVGVLAALVVAGGAWYWLMSEQNKADAGYPYACANGTHFIMTPAADMTSIALMPQAGASFTPVLLTQASSSAGARFEGGGVVFVGAGEGVTLTVQGESTRCSPVPQGPDMAPFNWGDPAEAGSIQPDAALVVSESIVGKWQSTQDASYVREFKDGGRVDDVYNGSVVSSGTYSTFTKASAPAGLPFPVEDNAVYLRISLQGSQAETLTFKVVKLTPEQLQLVYLDRGGVLDFKSIN